MPKFVVRTFYLFGIIGLCLFAGAYWSWSHFQGIVDGGVRTQGVVSRLERRSNGVAADTYAHVVEYGDRNGVLQTYRSSSASEEPIYSPGDTVDLYYTPGDPDRVLIDDFWSRWAAPVILALLGAGFCAFGWGVVFFDVRRRWITGHLKRHGVRIEARFVSCDPDTSTKLTGRSPWRVEARATHPATGRPHRFLSDQIWVDLTDDLAGKKVRVLVDPSDPKHHFVDLSQYIESD